MRSSLDLIEFRTYFRFEMLYTVVMSATSIDRPLRELSSNDTARCIVPSLSQYPHQWLWDSCFHAIVLAHLKPENSAREIESLLESQWDDGRVPHIAFSSTVPVDRYRPNKLDWKTGRDSSGIIQPPIIASAAKTVFQRTGDLGFLRRVYPKIATFHRWIQSTRDPRETGLVGIVHPWESGMDNSPLWDGLRDEFLKTLTIEPEIPPRVDTRTVPSAQRPTDDDYRYYWSLIEIFQKAEWDGVKMAERSPFFVADVMFNSLWAKANEDLSQIAWRLGEKSDSAEYRFKTAKTKRAIRDRLWSAKEKFFLSLDLRTGRAIEVKSVGGFAPLYAQAAGESMIESLVDHLRNPREFRGESGVPSVSFSDPTFNPECYWRGPVWINLQWMIVNGLIRSQKFDLASDLSARSQNLVAEQGYWEYYDPFNGKGLGASHFSWSTLADILDPFQPIANFKGGTFVLDAAEISTEEDLGVLYGNPKVQTEPIEEDQIRSSSSYVVGRILNRIRREIAARKNRRHPKADRLVKAAHSLKGLIESQRPAEGTRRFADLACLAGEVYFSGLGYKVEVRSKNVFHPYLLVTDALGEERVIDLCADIFWNDPYSRTLLHLERQSRRMKDEIASETPSWMRLEEGYLDTQVAVQRCMRRINVARLSLWEVKVLHRTIAAHAKPVEKVLLLALPSSSGFLKTYSQWLGDLEKALL
ncbi:MAG: hypothetical protein COB53_08135 [Elusimicrobia bacterium]|nr:MAG: hypothetical protein COB53_08135 [Elusimicrobiota bacterium]